MKMKLKQFSAMTLVIVMCMGMMSMVSHAALKASYYIDSVYCTVGAASGGKITVMVSVEATGTMSEVGAKQIKIQESTDGGKTYSTVKTYSYADYPEMMWYDENHYLDTPITYQGTAGYRYQAIATCYAGDSSGGDSRAYTSNSVVAKR